MHPQVARHLYCRFFALVVVACCEADAAHTVARLQVACPFSTQCDNIHENQLPVLLLLVVGMMLDQ